MNTTQWLVEDSVIMDLETGISATTIRGLTSKDRAIREEILHRAYAIWESEGHPADRKLANWLEAEAAVMAPRARRPGRPPA